jgi:hypothetical protein
MWRARLQAVYEELTQARKELECVPEAALNPESAVIYRAVKTVVGVLIRVIEVLP